MKYVNEKSAARARSFAERFQALPASAGIIFVAVAAVPVEGGDTNWFSVCIGMASRFDTDLGVTLVKKVLQQELENDEIVLQNLDVYRGVSGAARDRGNEGDASSRPS